MRIAPVAGCPTLEQVMRTAAVALTLCGLAVLGLSTAAHAQVPPSIPTFIGPVCVNGLGVSLNGGVAWGQLPVGDITLDWGDGTSISNPAPFPAAHTYGTAGTKTITVSASSSGAVGSASTLVAVGAGVQTCSYRITPAPIAPPNSLSASQQVTLTVGVVDARGNPVSSAPVWLSFAQAAGGGNATACCAFIGQSVPSGLFAAPQMLVTGVSQPPGTIAVTYTAGSALSPGGTDYISVQNAPADQTVVVTDSYSFGVAALASRVQGMNLAHGLENSLIEKLGAAQSSLGAGNQTAACNQLGAFVNEVNAQSGKQLTADQADQLIGSAQEIRNALSCLD